MWGAVSEPGMDDPAEDGARADLSGAGIHRAGRILMLAPEPFFEPRGTPFSEYHRIKALGALGHRIDLVTYPFGRDVALPNLLIFRCVRPPFMRGVRVGPSVAKLLLDALLAAAALRRLLAERYDAIHSHEEAGLPGVWFARWRGIPHLYDMHSSLPQQLANFRYPRWARLRRVCERACQRMERAMISGSRVVITICRELQDVAAAAGAGDRAVLIENVMGGDVGAGVGGPAERAAVRAEFGMRDPQPLILYTGTFETYQGLDLLFEAAARVCAAHPQARVLVVGGEAAQVADARRRLGDGGPVVFAGQRAPDEIPRFVAACDILASPRIAGTNTPLKIYSYLRSGRPIVATKLRTHTQVLDDDTALLVEPTPEAFAGALRRLIERPHERERLARAARALAGARYSREAYVARTAAAYARLLS